MTSIQHSKDQHENIHAQKLQRVCDYINQNLDEDFSLENLSKVAKCSKYHFSRLFTIHIGISTFQYIQLMRLKRASYHLAFNTEKKIIDIALEAQFENPESFSRAFKRVFNQSPSEFRKNQQWPQWQEIIQSTNYSRYTPLINRKNAMEIKIVAFEKTKVALLEHRGAPEKILESAGKFIEWRKQSQLSPVETSRTFGIAYDDPQTTEKQNFRFDICSSIKKDVPENSQGVKTSFIPQGRCAVIRHCGSHDKMDDKIRYLYTLWLPESKETLRDFPCFFHYHNLIPFVEEHELITDIYLPVI